MWLLKLFRPRPKKTPEFPPIPDNGTIQNRALSVRQPYAEMIMNGTKQIEYRSIITRIRGRVYIYASLQPGDERDFKDLNLKPGDLPTGKLIGSVQIIGCTGEPGDFEWYLANPVRLETLVKPERKPQPVWFTPFKQEIAAKNS